MLQRPVSFAAILAFLLITGCGRPSGSVIGKVTFDSQEVTHGQVTLIGSDHIPINADIQGDGSYVAKGVPYGQASIAVIQMPRDYKSPVEIRQEYESRKEIPPPSAFLPVKSLLPEKYGNAATSGLSVTVSQAQTKFDITLVKE